MENGQRYGLRLPPGIYGHFRPIAGCCLVYVLLGRSIVRRDYLHHCKHLTVLIFRRATFAGLPTAENLTYHGGCRRYITPSHYGFDYYL